MEIKRDLYLNKLIKRESNGLVKVITGIRRCGKSYLLFYLYHDYLINKGVNEDHLIEIGGFTMSDFYGKQEIYELLKANGIAFEKLGYEAVYTFNTN